jgi:hypothetical protein
MHIINETAGSPPSFLGHEVSTDELDDVALFVVVSAQSWSMAAIWWLIIGQQAGD